MTEILNRAFLYGESVFSTMRMQDGFPCDWDYHFDRLKRGVEFVYGPFIEGEEWSLLFRNQLESRYLSETGDKILRMTIFLEQARGLRVNRMLSISDLKVHLHASALEQVNPDKTISLRTCPAPARPPWWPSFLKAGNYLETILSQKKHLQDGDDDLLFLSSMDTILESSVANVFLVKHNKLYTAPVGPNVLEGVMRRKVLERSSKFFDEVLEAESSLEQLYKADAVFGSNSVRGLFLISRVDGLDLKVNPDALNQFKLLLKDVYEERN